jgi:hypothetical protein
MVEVHGGDMSARDKKDARRVQADFEFEEVGRYGRRGHRDREREPPSVQRPQLREPPPHQRRQPQEPPPPPLPIPPGPPGPRRRRDFGGALTAEGGASTPPNDHNTSDPSRPSSPLRGTDVDPAVAE